MLFERVQRLCNERKISIARLEKETGLGNATVRGWKTGNPSLKTVKAVADYFGMSVDELMRKDNHHDD